MQRSLHLYSDNQRSVHNVRQICWAKPSITWLTHPNFFKLLKEYFYVLTSKKLEKRLLEKTFLIRTQVLNVCTYLEEIYHTYFTLSFYKWTVEQSVVVALTRVSTLTAYRHIEAFAHFTPNTVHRSSLDFRWSST